MIKIGIVLGSTRPGRKSEAVGHWVLEQARSRSDAEFEIVDIAHYNLPLLDEPMPPSMGQYQKGHTKANIERHTTMNTNSRFAPTAARVLLGLVFFVFGLNGFLQFIPQPPIPDKAGAFMGALAATGYMFPLIKGVEVLAGALLLSNRFVPLALALLAPNVVNIVLFHTVLALGGLPIALVVLGLEIFAAWSYRGAYASMLRAQTAPTASSATAAVAAHEAS